MSGRQVRRRLRPQLVLAGLGLTVLGWFLGQAPAGTSGARVSPWFLVLGVGLLVGVAVFTWNRHAGSAGSVRWWSWRSRRNAGVASRWMVLRRASRFAVRAKAAVLRPCLRSVPWWAPWRRLAALRPETTERPWWRRRWLVPTTEYAFGLARVGLLTVWSAVEDIVVILGGPRVGKTGLVAGLILDAPGAVIATSTKTDVVGLTSELRAKVGPVYVFNPSALGGLASDITFDPLTGCGDPATAAARAQDLLSGSDGPGTGADARFWQDQAQRVLTPLLHAAALGGASMREVQAWAATPEVHAERVEHLLRRSPEPAFETDAAQFFATNDRTRSSISATIMPALRWLSDSTAAAAAAGGGSFDVAELLERRGTVYLLGREDTQVAPLVAALTGHIAREARRIATDAPGGRLDPPLTLALDEAALICPIPLDQWSADFGSRGIPMHIAVQSRAQLRQRWDENGSAAILNNSATLLLFGGMKDTDDLNAFSTLAGERYEDVPTLGEHGPMRQRVPVLPPSRIAALTPGRVVIFRRNMPVCLGRAPMAWKRLDVRGLAWKRRFAAALAWLARVTRSARARGGEATAAVRPKARAVARRVRDYRSGRRQAPDAVRRIHRSEVGGPGEHEGVERETAGSSTAHRGEGGEQ